MSSAVHYTDGGFPGDRYSYRRSHMGGAAGLKRGKTLSRPDRYQAPTPMVTGHKEKTRWDPWVLFSRLVTWWAPGFMLRSMGLPDPQMQQAWREKISLCFLIAIMGGIVAFLTVGLSRSLCPPDQANNAVNYIHYNDTVLGSGVLGIEGWQFNIMNSKPTADVNFYNIANVPGTDISNYFSNRTENMAACTHPSNQAILNFQAVTFNTCSPNNGLHGCPLQPLSASTLQTYNLVNTSKQVGFDWVNLAEPTLTNWFVIDGNVLNLDPYFAAYPNPIPNDTLDAVIRDAVNPTWQQGGKDVTKAFYRRDDIKAAGDCLVQKYYAGHIDKSTPGCFVSTLFLYIELIAILGIVLSRFAMALIFSWFMSWKLARTPPPVAKPAHSDVLAANNAMEMQKLNGNPFSDSKASLNSSALSEAERLYQIGNDLYTIMLVTCYSEGLSSIKTTLDSLAVTTYPDQRKMLFVVADGIITGSGNSESTPDICKSLMTFSGGEFKEPQPMSYVAVAQGSKQHNMAKVYAGHYVVGQHRVPMLLIAKCGTPEEQGKPKPGNRGKRDSQLILMNFFSRVTYNEKMTPLDYDLFKKIQYVVGVTPDYYEIVLMVDADTKVYPDSLRLLVNCMVNDHLIMGLCGETKIANKRDSWVTAIQVYEYYISHHLGKGFESIFGGVTCLPGCFCMYRLKARRPDDNAWVAILTKPEIVKEYSQNVVDTLHQKNLLLLGEDRFLTTLMLRAFPHRKMMFTPQAVCKTVVPDTFKVLLSQRRRWINSTIHNLLELVLVRNLCGTFCFSMQFVIFMDLMGTIVLPVALTLTAVLIITIATTHITDFASAMPLILLLVVIFSPAILILLTTKKWVYALWMGIYILALPVWNFVLPVYAYWHFDDFSWGETRKVQGEAKGDSHGGKDGQFDASTVPFRRWEDYEKQRVRLAKRMERKKRNQNNLNYPPSPRSVNSSAYYDSPTPAPALPNPPPQYSSQRGPAGYESNPRPVYTLQDDTVPDLGPQQSAFDPSREGVGRALSGYGYKDFSPPGARAGPGSQLTGNPSMRHGPSPPQPTAPGPRPNYRPSPKTPELSAPAYRGPPRGRGMPPR